jgi:hypothetical protein
MSQQIHKPLIWLFSLVAIAMIAYALNRGVYVGSDVSREDTINAPLRPYINPWLLSPEEKAKEEARRAADPMWQTYEAYEVFSTVARRVQAAIDAGQKPNIDDEYALQRGWATFGSTNYYKDCRYLFPSGIFTDRKGQTQLPGKFGWKTAKEAADAVFCTLFLR